MRKQARDEEIVRLRGDEGMSLREIAERMALSQKTVARILKRNESKFYLHGQALMDAMAEL